MVVLFRGESLIWFWGRHFFVQGFGGGVAAVPFLNETAVAMQYNPPPQSGCSILHNCAESVRWFILGTGCAVLWQGNFMKTKACRMAVLHQEEHQRVSRKWSCSYSDHWLVGSLVVTSQTGAFEYVTSGYGKLNCGIVVLLAEWLKNVLGSSVELKEQVQTFSTQLTPFLLQTNKKINASIFFDILPKILQHVDMLGNPSTVVLIGRPPALLPGPQLLW